MRCADKVDVSKAFRGERESVVAEFLNPAILSPSRYHNRADDCSPCTTVLAAANKYLAKSNKSRTGS
jgi:hypothetical protein